jgi:CSLREA domain-containing protein
VGRHKIQMVGYFTKLVELGLPPVPPSFFHLEGREMTRNRQEQSGTKSCWFVGMGIALCAIFLSTSAQAAVFAVNSPEDGVDANPGNGVCETAPGNGVCTLRAAIQEANTLPGADEITLLSNVYLLTMGCRSEGVYEWGRRAAETITASTETGSARVTVNIFSVCHQPTNVERSSILA